MDMITEAFRGLFPDRAFLYEGILKYSGRFKGYNANVRLSRKTMIFSLSKRWRPVSREIKIGLIQELMVRILKERGHTSNIDMYNYFMKNLHMGIVKDRQDPFLMESFNRVNQEYFMGMLEAPNLVFGKKSCRKLGSYDFGTDTITISTVLRETDPEVLDYVMYHEMLHKKHKFRHCNGRSYHHTAEFRQKEKKFKDSELMEQRLKQILKKGSFLSVFKGI
ncbi:DUF45 domain-containing protein [Candidatus Woesearchaeota archaeon]|nr:DUF45 domain-containing protein [Candidatus Woesearchaeota archaeon]